MNGNILMIVGTTVLPSVVIAIVLVFTLANVYLNIRRRFPVKVNCWFCNANTSVPYDQANCFVCPSCAQYNGFTADGDYNREIPEQYQQRYHGRYCYTQPRNITDDDKWGTTRSVASAGHNGLCFGCNRNQELKIHQLASFVPEDENNYDAEVEEYRKQLEQAYKLCGRCERILKRTLNDVKRNILGSKLAQIGSKGLSVLDMHMRASSKQIARLNRQRWARLCVYAITLLVAMKLPQQFSDAGWTIADLVALCPAPLMNLGTNLLSYLLALYQLMNDHAGRLLAEPAIQHTTERIETLGVELFQMYGAPLVCSPKQFFDSFNEQVASGEQDASVLLNVAIVALAALLATLGSHRTALKQIVIIALALVDCFLRYQHQRIDLGLYFSLIALALSVSCIGQRSIRSDVADGNLNSSFHKIYSQQCSEADYSDADTTAGSQSFAHGPSTDAAACQISPPTPHTVANASRKSLDTTKSCSPSSTFSMSTTNPFYMSSNGLSPTAVGMETSKISGSLFNVPEAVSEAVSSSASVFNRSINAGSSSLLKTPSFSVADFSKVPPHINSRTAGERHQGLKGGGGFHHSMSTINRPAMQSLREDPLIEDDIDRLSISGRASLNASRSSRMSLGGSNPFAQIDQEAVSSVALRRRRIVSPLEMFPVAEESPWSQVTAAGEVGASVLGQPHMSRTSSQSSGFESQSATRRNTPTEGDALSVYTGADSTLRHDQPPSPVPSSASVLYRNPGNNSLPWSSNHRQQQHHHSLFSQQSLFKHAAHQPQFSGPRGGGLFFPRPSAYNAATNGFGGGSMTGSTTSSSAASTAYRNFGHIFPPQQSQTPSYHYHHHQQQQPSTLATNTSNNHNSLLLNSSFLGAPAPLTPDRSSLFNATATAGLLGTIVGTATSQPPQPSLAGASFLASPPKPTARLRASLLDLAKLNNELNDGKVMPTG
ncbi:uncharacterized protein LOC118461032 [Anopheles albimanus]|uniref:Ima1 N-terminal domain-containing protein n=1 Tax=Anopheles albimanus TaxID=7167 RepID=A0A182FNR6_ANOAL|nr:uncharacterized protein LOC118461032 [Anopheles albimanus]